MSNDEYELKGLGVLREIDKKLDSELIAAAEESHVHCSLLIYQGVPRLVSRKGRKIEYAKAAEIQNAKAQSTLNFSHKPLSLY